MKWIIIVSLHKIKNEEISLKFWKLMISFSLWAIHWIEVWLIAMIPFIDSKSQILLLLNSFVTVLFFLLKLNSFDEQIMIIFKEKQHFIEWCRTCVFKSNNLYFEVEIESRTQMLLLACWYSSVCMTSFWFFCSSTETNFN